jgi:nifR3 family TIM-barrel protein
MNFWDRLAKPFFAMAPMADVTDPAFRRMIAKYSMRVRSDGTMGGPDVMWTEFVSADGLVRAPEEGKQKLLADLQYDESERPIVAQLFTSNPAHMEIASRMCLELGFDGVDINMGCPDRSIEKQGAGAAHIRNPHLATEVILAAKEGARHDGGGIPVSVKTRLGYNTDILDEWLPVILRANPAAVTIHARTRKDMSKVPARWERVKRAVEIRNECGSSARILGNGDALSRSDARIKARESGADGVMLGRAIFGNPWLFGERSTAEISLGECLRVMVEHTKLFEELLPHKSFAIMKKHYKAYVAGFEGAAELRLELMEAAHSSEVERIVERYISERQVHPL